MSKSPENETPEHDTAAIAAKIAGGCGAAFTLAALGLYDPKTALGVFVGSSIAVANLVSMRALIRAMLPAPEAEPEKVEKEEKVSADGIDDLDEMAERELAKEEAEEREPAKTQRHDAHHVEAGKRGGAAWGIFAVLKIVFLFGGIYILLTRRWVDPMPLAAGYGVLPLGIFASAAWANLAPKKPSKRRKR